MAATLADIQAKYGEAVYPLYKDQMHEPYMENDNGKGYRGVVLYDEHNDKVQCAECGEWFEHLQAHTRIKHKITMDEYKNKNGLNKSIAVCSRRISNERAQIAETRLGKYKYKKGEKNPFSTSHRDNLVKANKQSKKTVMFKNKYGLCDAQMAARLVIVRDMTGKSTIEELTNRDLENNDINLYQHLRNKYGSFELACKSLGVSFIGQNRYSESEMISQLRKFVMQNKTYPRTKADLGRNGLPSYDTYKARFGSWRRAKMMAGLDQLLEEVKSSE